MFMALPANFNMKDVACRYIDFNGKPMAGQVTFTPPVARINLSEGPTVMVPTTVALNLDSQGRVAGKVPAHIGFRSYFRKSGTSRSLDRSIGSSSKAIVRDVGDSGRLGSVRRWTPSSRRKKVA